MSTSPELVSPCVVAEAIAHPVPVLGVKAPVRSAALEETDPLGPGGWKASTVALASDALMSMIWTLITRLCSIWKKVWILCLRAVVVLMM